MNYIIRLILHHWPMGVLRALIGILLIEFILLGLCSCHTNRYAEKIQTHDTIRLHHTDTLFLWKTKILMRDTIARDTVLIERDTTGRIIYKEVTRFRTLRFHHTDTLFLYRSATDTTARIATSITKQSKKTTKHCIPSLVIVGTIVVLLIAIVAEWLRIRRKS